MIGTNGPAFQLVHCPSHEHGAWHFSPLVLTRLCRFCSSILEFLYLYGWVALQRAAAANVLNAKVYARLNLGLATWAALSLILSLLSHQYFQRTALM
jgi:hypothetical protein